MYAIEIRAGDEVKCYFASVPICGYDDGSLDAYIFPVVIQIAIVTAIGLCIYMRVYDSAKFYSMLVVLKSIRSTQIRINARLIFTRRYSLHV